MKFRFRLSGRHTHSHLKKGTRLRLAGKNTLRSYRHLPEQIEDIRLDGDIPARKKRSRALSLGILKIYKKIYACIILFFGTLAGLFKRFFTFIGSTLRKSAERSRTIDSLPMLFGGACACLLVCTLTAAYILLSLFAPYARRYEAVTVPSLRGKQLSEIEYPTDSFNLIIQYENNPDVSDGQIISQAPRAGVVRRLYGKDSCCDILLTVSRHDESFVPHGIVGSPLRDALLSLSNSGLTYTVNEEYSDTVDKGNVIRAYPSDGSKIEAGGCVKLSVSLGKISETVRVPDLVGLGESEAAERLRQSGLTLGEVSYISSTQPMGKVTSQSPAAYTEADRGSAISLFVSAGSNFTLPTVPDLYGMTVEQARTRLLGVGLTVSAVYSVSSAAPSGAIISQSPLPGTAITSAVTSVELYISN